MGYYMDQMVSSFTIKHENKAGALKAIKSMAGKETIEDSGGPHFSWVNTEDFLNAKTLEEALKVWRWEAETKEREPEEIDKLKDEDFDFNPDDELPKLDIVGLTFYGEKMGDDSFLFEHLAPYVEDDSYIEMSGEDNYNWRWVFKNGTMTEISPEIIWPEV
jgi:hypothetical protein